MTSRKLPNPFAAKLRQDAGLAPAQEKQGAAAEHMRAYYVAALTRGIQQVKSAKTGEAMYRICEALAKDLSDNYAESGFE